MHAPTGIRTHNLSRRAAVDLRLRPRGDWDRRCQPVANLNFVAEAFHDTMAKFGAGRGLQILRFDDAITTH